MVNLRWTGVSGDWSMSSEWSANAVSAPSDRAVIRLWQLHGNVSTSETVG